MAEPLTLAEAKAHLRITHASEDSYITDLIAAARLDIESDTWRALVRGTRTLVLSGFPPGDDPIWMPRPPLVSVDAVLYVDASGSEQELDSFRVDASHEPGQLLPAFGAHWPDTRETPDAVTITYTAGYADGSVPANAKHCVRLKLSELYEGRTPSVQEKRTSLDRLLEKLRFRDSRILPFLRGEIPDVHLGL